MPSLLDSLQAFNRRERHILVGWVLDRLTFPLGHEFRDDLSEILDPIRVPADSYVAMDYNLNWLAAAILWSENEIKEGEHRVYDATECVELGDNSDTDLLIAFARGAKTHVVLLEAKGYTKWDTKQLKHKIERLSNLFGNEGTRFPSVAPYWVFVSPGPPPDLPWAQWMLDPGSTAEPRRPRHLPLPQPASHKFAIARCDSEGRSKDGGHWMIRTDPWPVTIE